MPYALCSGSFHPAPRPMTQPGELRRHAANVDRGPERHRRDQRAEADRACTGCGHHERQVGLERVPLFSDEKMIRSEKSRKLQPFGQVKNVCPALPGQSILAFDHQSDPHVSLPCAARGGST